MHGASMGEEDLEQMFGDVQDERVQRMQMFGDVQDERIQQRITFPQMLHAVVGPLA